MTDNMRYLQYLKEVVRLDVNGLLEKERTYQGSWKKSGGRSAWFMVKRKIDRLQELMKRPDPPKDFDLDSTLVAVQNLEHTTGEMRRPGNLTYQSVKNVMHLADVFLSEDVFAKVTQEEILSAGNGPDGSVIAEIRDLRRYLILIEAELMARGVIPVRVVDDESLHAEYNDDA